MKPLPKRLKQILVLVLLLIAVQIGGVLVYRAIEDDRHAKGTAAFTYDRVSGEPRGLDASLVTTNGTVTTLRASIGEPLFVHFWATWCEPCRTELPELLELAHKRNVRVVLVSVDESREVIRHFFEGKVPPQVVLDEEGSARRAFAISSLPDTFLLDREGRPTTRFHGARNWLSAEARAELDRMLAR